MKDAGIGGGQRLTVSGGRGCRKHVRLIAAEGYLSSHQIYLGAAAGVGADPRVLIEVQLTRVHDLPMKPEPDGNVRSRSEGRFPSQVIKELQQRKVHFYNLYGW